MAQNITLLGASYSDVPAVELPKTGGGNATFTDVTDTTAVASDVATGKYFYLSDGSRVQGTSSGGGGGGSVTQDQDGYIILPPDGGGSSITVEALSVTQNGTYTAPTGKAYSPVTVNVSGGGGGISAPKKQINFIDYDGTIVESYTKTEWASVSALPSNPSHTGLTSQGWNWTKVEIDAQLTAIPDGDVWVGQMYITQSGDTEIDVIFPDSARLAPVMTIAVNGTIEVDWGDNTTADTVTGTSLTTRTEVPHTYATTGSYMITIHVVSGSFSIYGSTTYTLLRKNTSANENRVYSNYIQAVRLGNGVTNLGSYAFNNCFSLKSVTIPSGVTDIGNNTFYYCYSLASVTIPSGATSVRGYAFSSCYSLMSVTIPGGATSIENYAFNNCYGLGGVTIPNGVTSLNNNTFASCYSLASVKIPNGVTSIGANVFNNCNTLTSATIPSGVTSIGNNAFSNCYGVAEYHIKPTTPPTLGNTVFNNIVSDCKIYVPSASLSTYQTTTGWSTYASYMVGE